MMDSHTVLVIDDDPDIRDVIAETLTDEGFHVVASGDGQTAVDLALKEPPGLIVLDLMMPTMSGWQVMNALRASPSGSNIPIVLVSASRNLEQTAHHSHVAAYLAKPFDLDALIAIVQRYIGSASA